MKGRVCRQWSEFPRFQIIKIDFPLDGTGEKWASLGDTFPTWHCALTISALGIPVTCVYSNQWSWSSGIVCKRQEQGKSPVSHSMELLLSSLLLNNFKSATHGLVVLNIILFLFFYWCLSVLGNLYSCGKYQQRPKGVLDPLELELWAAVSYLT